MGEAFIMRRGSEEPCEGEFKFELVMQGGLEGGREVIIPELIGCSMFNICIYDIACGYGGANAFIYSLTYINGQVIAAVRNPNEDVVTDSRVGITGTSVLVSFDETQGKITLKEGHVFALPQNAQYCVHKIT